ncbi:MAG: DUF1801 domain-containing protein [Planctomycetota bacterium]|nr:DUF1801 domain-containing protein [Planctomycetota bacterium]
MTTSKARNVDQFLNENDSIVRPALTALRKIMKATSPKTKESMQYGFPTYSLLDKPFAAFNVEKNVLAVYVKDEELVAARKNDIGSVDYAKGWLRSRKFESFNLDVLAEIVNLSVAQRLKAEAIRRGPMPRSEPKKATGAT